MLGNLERHDDEPGAMAGAAVFGTGDLLDGLNLKFHVRNSSALSDMHRTELRQRKVATPINVGQSIRPLRRMASVGMTSVDNAPTAAPRDGSLTGPKPLRPFHAYHVGFARGPLQLKDRFKKSLSMSGEVGSLAGAPSSFA